MLRLVAELYPPLPQELVAFAEGGVSILVGTASAKHEPDCVRGMGLRIWPGGAKLTVILPIVTGETSIANLRENPRLALTISHIPSHRTMQVKGPVIAIRDGGQEELELGVAYRAKFSEDLAFVGQPPANTLRLGIWPCVAVDIEIAVAFVQTPGPQAGIKLTPESRGSL